MGLEEEWMPLAANPCPNCGRAVKSTAATCVHCGLILDEKKFAEFKFASVPTAPPPSTGLRVAGSVR
jgi:predicted amidophosphoribosyltransferase